MKKRMEYGSDVIADILRQQEIEYIAYNPGSTITAICDSLVHFDDRTMPNLILCCHEEIAIAIAHGYAKVSEKPMAVLLHSNVGLQHAAMAIFNAWCDRVPLLIISGIGPMDSKKRRPWIDWIHTSQYQTSIINDYVKWHDQPYSLSAVEESLQRAIYLTNVEPKAPTYVAIDTSIQEKAVEDSRDYSTLIFKTKNNPPQVSSEAIQNILDALLKASLPIIIVDYVGRNCLAVNYLVHLSDYLNIPVLDCGGRYNFPNTHELCLTGKEAYLLEKADYILALDVQDLQGFLDMYNYKNNSFITHVTLSDYLINSWAADYQKFCSQAEYCYGDSTKFLQQLLKILSMTNNEQVSTAIKEREYLRTVSNTQRKLWLEEATTQLSADAITIPALLLKIWIVIKDEQWMLANFGNVIIGQWARRLWEFKEPFSYQGFSGGAGLGYGLGASIGAALACKDKHKICINLQTDGDFLVTPSALWTAAHNKLPLLIIVINNNAYGNTKCHAIQLAKKRGRNYNNMVGSDINQPVVNYSKLSESFGIKSFASIQEVSQIEITLKKALVYIKKHKKPVLVDVMVE